MNRLTTTARALVATALLSAALLSWVLSGVAADLAAQHGRQATLAPMEPAADGWAKWMSPLIAMIDPDVERHAMTEAYWRGRLDPRGDARPAGTSRAADAAALLLTANAAFRRAEREAGAPGLRADRLDPVLQAYASALKNGGYQPDAAYNYELVARLRDAAAQPRSQAARGAAGNASPRRPAQTGVVLGDDLPSGPTIHGRPGMHPPSSRGEEFEVITPMDYGDREAQPEPTPGRRLPRKG